jgi:hypothetical protein
MSLARIIRSFALATVAGVAATSMAGAQGASPSPLPEGTGIDRAALLALCQQNATTPEDLAACLDVVDRFLAPEAPVGPSAPAAVNDKVTVKGSGEKSTEAFELGGGDYLATLNVRDTDKSSFRSECTARGSLKRTEDNDEAASVRATAPSRGKGKIQSYIYGLDPGRYYWDFDLTDCGRWDVTLASTTIDYSEPAPGPIVRSGTDTFDTEAFALTGGDYLVTTKVKAGSGECRLSGYLIPVAEYNMFASVGDISLEVPERKTQSGESRLYSVEPGQYYWSISTLALAIDKSACKWTITLTEQ